MKASKAFFWAIFTLEALGGVATSAYDVVGLPVGGPNADQWVIYQTNQDAVSWTTAFANAASMTEPVFGTGIQGRLLTPDTQDKNDIAAMLARNTGDTWIAATDQEMEGVWKWATTGVSFWFGTANGTPINNEFSNWNAGEPNDSYSTYGEDYARINSTGLWNDLWDDYASLKYWAEFQTEITGTDVASLPDANVNYQFTFDSTTGTYLSYARTTNRYNWYLAKVIAEKAQVEGVSGQLPMIDSAEKNAEVAATGGGWIGLHCDPNLGGTPGASSTVNYPGSSGFFWSGADGETAFDPNTFESWRQADGSPAEPNNSGGSEWHVEINSSGDWNDLGYTATRNVIIEFPGLDLSERQYAKGFLVREVRDANSGSGGNGGVANVEPRRLINGLRTQSGPMLETQIAALNIVDPDVPSGGHFGGDAVFQTDQPGADDNNFAIKAYATIVIPEAGTYTFGRSSDDAIELVFDRGAAGVHRYVAGTGTSSTEVTFDAPGEYNLYALNGETGGGAGVELAAAKGTFSSDSEFLGSAVLVGDKLNGGLETRNLRTLSTAGNFTVDAGGPTVTPAKINYGARTTGITGDYGFDQAFPDETGDGGLTATTQIVVPENAGGWWTFGLNSTKGARMTLIDANSNPVAFGHAYGEGAQLNGGAVELTEFANKGSAFGAVDLAPGTYTLTTEYGTPASVRHPTLTVTEGFDLQLTWFESGGGYPSLDTVNEAIDAGAYYQPGLYYVGLDDNPYNHPIDDVPVVNYGSGSNSHFASDAPFPGVNDPYVSGDIFVMQATGEFVVDADSAGYWTFCVSSDDGFELRIRDKSDSSIVPFEQSAGDAATAIDANGYLEFADGRGGTDSFGTIYLEEGTYDLDLRWFEWGGGECVELSYAQGEQLAWNSELFQLLGNSQPAPDNLFEVFYAAGNHDGFDGAFDLLGDNLVFEDQSEYYNGGVTELPGDLNGDGAVNSDDLNLVRGHWGEVVSPNTDGDATGDGFVNSDDLNIVRANWGATAAAAVPEPSTIVVLLGLCVSVLRGRKRRYSVSDLN